ncbi:polysaccharide lyase family 8 super-sandwich domain-containing protein [Occultella aeris]|uniref:Xanthan lyase n=1 Tax=Occultella aeris TaxID=2761496 RepID=A0A7M4DK81_9MICO|nr:polysaccharide lyase family 8 super-sandwich domain-containing protein [Occultella aeris]VZO37474.1 Xanthan lyase precursor [Occultella aeris]
MPDIFRRVSRRQFVTGVGGLTAVSMLSPVVTSEARADTAPTEDTFAAMRARWSDYLTGGQIDLSDPVLANAAATVGTEAEQHMPLIDRSAGRIRVFTDLPLTEVDSAGSPEGIRDTFLRMRALALAYATAGSGYHQDPGLRADLLEALETCNQTFYNETQQEFGSWYVFEIAATKAITDVCTLVYDHIPKEALARYMAAIDHFVPDPRYCYPPDSDLYRLSTGANRIDLCQAIALRGMLEQDVDRIGAARDALAEVLVYSTRRDGVYQDGSFVQHQFVAYNGAYGGTFLGGNARHMVLLAGTPWEFSVAERQFMFDAVDKAFHPLIYSNETMDFVRGRAASRRGIGGHGLAMVHHTLTLADTADAATAARWRSTCQGWLDRMAFQDPLSGSVQETVAIKSLMDDASVPPAPEMTGHYLFNGMARAVHRRPGWALAIAMASQRIAFYETLNGENHHGFHTGNAATYLYTDDDGHYADEYQPTVDPYRIPGTTVDKAPLPNRPWGAYPRPENATWAGGTVLDDFAVIGTEVDALTSPLRGKKSWFCLDEYVVALGSGITARPHQDLAPAADAHVRSGEHADRNYGSEPSLTLKAAGSHYAREAYLAFDISAVEGEIVAASLHLYAKVDEGTHGETDLDIHRVDGEWAEGTITWNNRPAVGDPLGSVHVDHALKWCSTDVTSYVQERAGQPARLSFALTQRSPDGPGPFTSVVGRAGNAIWRPYLRLELADTSEATTPSHIETIVENRNLHADGVNTLIVDGVEQSPQQGWSAELDGVGWAHLEDVGGYVFPGGTSLSARREERTGSWAQINDKAIGEEGEAPITRRYLTLWFDHGTDPVDQTYAYLLVPGASIERTAELATNTGEVQILANDANRQAVRVPRLGITAVNFWVPGTIAGITVEQPCSVMIRERGGELSAAISDPTQQPGSLSFSLARAGYRTAAGGHNGVSATVARRLVSVRVDTRGTDGATHTAVFRRH